MRFLYALILFLRSWCWPAPRPAPRPAPPKNSAHAPPLPRPQLETSNDWGPEWALESVSRVALTATAHELWFNLEEQTTDVALASLPVIAPRLPCPPAPEQARQFLAVLKRQYGGQRVFAHHLEGQLYPAFCEHKGWRRRPWNVVAKHLKSLTGGKRLYEWVDLDGERRRWRVYQIPAIASTPQPKTRLRAPLRVASVRQFPWRFVPLAQSLRSRGFVRSLHVEACRRAPNKHEPVGGLRI
jgi:hypothetical protein